MTKVNRKGGLCEPGRRSGRRERETWRGRLENRLTNVSARLPSCVLNVVRRMCAVIDKASFLFPPWSFFPNPASSVKQSILASLSKMFTQKQNKSRLMRTVCLIQWWPWRSRKLVLAENWVHWRILTIRSVCAIDIQDVIVYKLVNWLVNYGNLSFSHYPLKWCILLSLFYS